MTLRRAHGNGAPALLRSERRPLDELPPLNADDTARGLALRQERGRPFQRGNAAAKGRKPALASASGIPLHAKDPDYKRALGWARRYRARRVAELGVQHGGELSAGVCSMITSAALDMAASRYLTIKATKTSDAKLMATASKIAMNARQQELTALDVADREAKARPKDPNAKPGWLVALESHGGSDGSSEAK